MIGRIVEVADDRRHLSMHRGLMMVRDTANDQKELGQVPLDDIAAVIANAHGLSYTNNLLVALAERGAPFVLCGANHNVVGMLLSVDGHFEQAKRIEAQIATSLPKRKRLWAAIVRSDRNIRASPTHATPSLVDWDMRADRNSFPLPNVLFLSLVDWDMRSDRNSALIDGGSA